MNAGSDIMVRLARLALGKLKLVVTGADKIHNCQGGGEVSLPVYGLGCHIHHLLPVQHLLGVARGVHLQHDWSSCV
jgi:hypothetical protein